jgi:hypothetical protein
MNWDRLFSNLLKNIITLITQLAQNLTSIFLSPACSTYCLQCQMDCARESKFTILGQCFGTIKADGIDRKNILAPLPIAKLRTGAQQHAIGTLI